MDSLKIKEIAKELGADLCGIAPVERFTDAPAGFHPCDVLPECKSVIVIAKKFLNSTLFANSTIPYSVVRNELSSKLNQMVISLAEILEKKGFIAIPVSTLGPVEYDALEDRWRGVISLKHAAVYAGLGKMGKNSLLINDKYGNMLWLSAVLVSQELQPDDIAEYQPCPQECRLCIESCPVNALDENPMNQKKCYIHAFKNTGEEMRITCFNCRKICPNALKLKNDII